MKTNRPLRLGFLASGRGSNMLSIISACEEGMLDATPVVIISNNEGSGTLQIAREKGIPAFYISSRTHPTQYERDRTITATLREHRIDLLVLAGYLKKVGPLTLKTYHNRILNIHPSLLPAHGGPGMYGMKVHESVIAAGDQVTGVTVHLVNENYDEGRVLAQIRIEVEDKDTPETLAARVLEHEHRLYVKVLQDIVAGRINLDV